MLENIGAKNRFVWPSKRINQAKAHGILNNKKAIEAEEKESNWKFFKN